MSSAGVGPLCFLKANVTAPVYQDILEHFMLRSDDQLLKDADLIFQQDLAPAHTAKSTKSWLNDHGVGVLDWPANSPDLNPIEHIWGIVKRKMVNCWPSIKLIYYICTQYLVGAPFDLIPASIRRGMEVIGLWHC